MKAIAVLVMSAAAAHAAPVRLADGITLEVTRDAVLVHRGALTAHLADAGRRHYFGDAAPVIDSKARTVTVSQLDNCTDMPAPLVLTFDQAASRLDNVDAYRLHVQKKYADAARGFAKAVAEDPANRVAAINLASAQQLLGKRADAVATLAPWLAREPEAMYATVVADPELAPLLTEPQLVAVAAKAPGRVTALAASFPDHIGYSPERHELAVWRDECSWGGSGPDTCDSAIELLDAATGKLVASLPLAEMGDGADRKTRARHAAAAERTLHDLGFSAPAVVVATETTTDADHDADKRKFVFANLGVGVVSVSGAVNVLRRNTSLATSQTLEHLGRVVYVRDAHALVLSSTRPGAEGCESTDPTATDVVSLSL